MALCCVECKPCIGHCLPPGRLGLFKSRSPAQQLRRALGKMKLGATGRRMRPRRPGSFSSVRAVFWPLMSMRSEADARNDDDARPPTADTNSPDDTVSSGGGAAAASTTAARVIALQARLGGEGEAPRAPTTPLAANKATVAAAGDGEGKAIVVRHGDVEAACRRFERHLMKMLVEERKVMDLTDVEDLLCCWDKLTCPAFVHLVGRFYGQLCMDLFSSAQDAADGLVCSSQSSEEEDLSSV